MSDVHQRTLQMRVVAVVDRDVRLEFVAVALRIIKPLACLVVVLACAKLCCKLIRQIHAILLLVSLHVIFAKA